MAPIHDALSKLTDAQAAYEAAKEKAARENAEAETKRLEWEATAKTYVAEMRAMGADPFDTEE